MEPLLFFDDRLEILGPLNDLRASFDVRIGATTIAERWEGAAGAALGAVVPEWLAPIVQQQHHRWRINPALPTSGPVRLVNGRCPLVHDDALELACGEWIAEGESGHLIAAHLEIGEAAKFLSGDGVPSASPRRKTGTQLLSRPWHAKTFRDACLSHDLAAFVRAMPAQDVPRAHVMGEHPVRVAASARIDPGVVLDAESGPIVIDEQARVRPLAVIIGPAYIGPHATVLDGATIRGGTSIGPWCKVNGEIGGTTFQGYSNKAHYGYVGDSWIGEWVNLGAGTTTSNLLNTYGEIVARAEHDGRNERTGQQFLGPIIGDHVKTAICTRIMTGSVLGTGGMFATTAPVTGSTTRFSWATDAGTKAFRLDKFIDIMIAAMVRRNVVPSAAYIVAVSNLHAQVVHRP
jgi:UDP-N-acetylglucosamine diphosphorylase/glucosamine-1-phosphate N-acetyltransferase